MISSLLFLSSIQHDETSLITIYHCNSNQTDWSIWVDHQVSKVENWSFKHMMNATKLAFLLLCQQAAYSNQSFNEKIFIIKSQPISSNIVIEEMMKKRCFMVRMNLQYLKQNLEQRKKEFTWKHCTTLNIQGDEKSS